MSPPAQTQPLDLARTLPRPATAPPEDAGGVWQPPREFDGYRLLSPLGEGVMGRVYLAYDTVLERATALKLVDAGAPELGGRERFLTEARAVARLQHPNVVAIYRVGEVEGRPYLVSEFVRGKSLDALATPLSSSEVLRIGVELARGLAAAHRRGVLHRDIKPANAILADSGEVKLLDFGLAKLTEAGRPEGAPGNGSPLRTNGALEGPERPSDTSGAPAPRPPPDRLRGSTLTDPGTLMGTPAYMAPEAWRGEAVSFRSDVYSLGAVLYQLLTGTPPYLAETLDALQATVLEGRPPPLTGVEPALATVVLRCLRTVASERYASGEELRGALEALTPERQREVLPEGNPYRGLSAFEAEHRALFFGRDAEVRALLERLRTEPFLLVAGTSGVGKSSLCRAGLLPRVAEGQLESARPWTMATFTPGKHPLTQLAAALAPYLGMDEDALVWRIRASWDEVAQDLRWRQRTAGPLFLFIDQLEELVTLSDGGEARVMAAVLETFATPAPGLRLLATCRGDYIARLASLPAMGEELTRALYLLRPLSSESIREAVVGPALAKGVSFESDALVASLVDSATRAEGALPLLQFALAELWEAREVERGRIPASALAAMGGVEGALARHADGVLDRLLPQQRVAARRILVSLVTLEGTRARRTEVELGGADASVQGALAALVRGRLLVAGEASEGSAYEVAHEALIGTWTTLRRWLEEDSERRIVRERLAVATAEWERLGRKRDALWSRRQLGELRLLDGEDLQERERAFVAASHLAVRRRRWMLLGASGALLLLVAAASLSVRLKARRELGARIETFTSKGEAALRAARAHDDPARAKRTEAFSRFDAGALPAAEGLWSEALSLDAAADEAYAQAAQAAESALTLRSHEDRARALLADVLLARALLSERRHEHTRRDELIARLALYDDDGVRGRFLQAPARLQIETPSGAQLTLSRPDGTQARALPAGARTEVELSAGAHQLTALVPGLPPVRLPLLLERGEVRTLRLELPASAPEGFVFIPAGRFLFGVAGDEGMRRDFFNTAPLHPVEGGAFFIQRYETTFGEWLTYLEALPAPERALRMPAVGTGGFQGSLSLTRAGRGWELAMQPGGKRMVARSGERLRFEERAPGAEADWLRMPVVGISLADAEAYAAWLAETGRVPHARLCDEAEWERAARGADGRDYPHGEALLPQDANFDETYGKRPLALGPDEVGSHPRSRSPFGIDDLAGNVWEWTRSRSAAGESVVRGGSFALDRNSARSSNRELVQPSFEDVTLGLRVCADTGARAGP